MVSVLINVNSIFPTTMFYPHLIIIFLILALSFPIRPFPYFMYYTHISQVLLSAFYIQFFKFHHWHCIIDFAFHISHFAHSPCQLEISSEIYIYIVLYKKHNKRYGKNEFKITMIGQQQQHQQQHYKMIIIIICDSCSFAYQMYY